MLVGVDERVFVDDGVELFGGQAADGLVYHGEQLGLHRLHDAEADSDGLRGGGQGEQVA